MPGSSDDPGQVRRGGAEDRDEPTADSAVGATPPPAAGDAADDEFPDYDDYRPL